jgi:CRISPR/Cas system-associated exonuclease Cas4 (RecB family)/phosphoglycolate phosphatase-like HAD superfamily hydrolase
LQNQTSKDERTASNSSLDSFLDDSTDPASLSEEERKEFESWVQRILEEPSKISEMISNALQKGMYSEWEEESASHKFKLGSYYPSMIEHCLRQQAYSYLYPLPPTSEQLNIFGEGRAIHELVALALRRSGLISIEGREVVVDLEFGEGVKLHGRIDDLLLIRMTTSDELAKLSPENAIEKEDNSARSNRRSRKNNTEFSLFVPLEIKSTTSLPDEPKQAHYYQLSTYLHARNYPIGVLLYWAKRGGGVRAFAIKKDEAMYYVLRERVFELHEAIKTGELPQKEAAKNRDFRECELCPYLERCNPFLIESIPQGSKIAVFDLDTTLLDPLPRRRAILQELGLPSTIRPSDIHEDELREKFWEMYENPKYVSFDSLIDQGKENVYSHLQRGHAVVGISSSRRYRAMDATLARLANLGVPLNHLILKEEGNYDGDTRFKAKWASRLATNYEIVEYFDRDAAAYSLVARTIEQAKQRRGRADKKLESN